VIRPEFGRDDEVNEHGQLHHSYGFYSTHRVASIFWGPDFNQGVNRTTVVSAVDLTPTLAKLFGVEATYAQGSVLPGLFRDAAQFG
jgi:arylsulfatase A-like enzyme